MRSLINPIRFEVSRETIDGFLLILDAIRRKAARGTVYDSALLMTVNTRRLGPVGTIVLPPCAPLLRCAREIIALISETMRKRGGKWEDSAKQLRGIVMRLRPIIEACEEFDADRQAG